MKDLDFPTPEGDQWEAIETDHTADSLFSVIRGLEELFSVQPSAYYQAPVIFFPKDPVLRQDLLEVVGSCEGRRLFLWNSTAGSL